MANSRFIEQSRRRKDNVFCYVREKSLSLKKLHKHRLLILDCIDLISFQRRSQCLEITFTSISILDHSLFLRATVKLTYLVFCSSRCCATFMAYLENKLSIIASLK